MKRLLLSCCALVLSLCAVAQIDLALASEGQKMVRNALTDAVVLVRQNYVLVNAKNEEYGRAGQEYFGRAYGVGLFTDCGLAMPTTTAEPWRVDNAYDKYRNSDEYHPKASFTELRYAGQSQYKTVTFENPEFVYTQDSTLLYASGIQKETTIHAELPQDGEVSGWLVLMTSSGNLETDESATVSVDAYKYSITFDMKNILYPIEQTSAMRVKNILGGAFFIPTYTTGQIIFKYAGVLVMKDNEWYLEKIDKIFLNCNSVKDNSADTLNKLSSPQIKNTVSADTAKAIKAKKDSKKTEKNKTEASQKDKNVNSPAAQNTPAVKKEETEEELSPVKK